MTATIFLNIFTLVMFVTYAALHTKRFRHKIDDAPPAVQSFLTCGLIVCGSLMLAINVLEIFV